MRKHFFNDSAKGYFKTQKRDPVMKNPMTGWCPIPRLASLLGSTLTLYIGDLVLC